jgi:hypothetical protein
MRIHLRKRQQRKKGKVSLYLEIYKGKTTTANGKIKYLRDYEYLDIYLIANPKTEAERIKNKEMLQLANTIKTNKEVELQAGRYGIQTTKHKDSNFCEYFYHFVEKRRNSPDYKNFKGLYNTFIKFAGDYVFFSDVNENFCERFLHYLQNMQSLHNRPLKNSTIKDYLVRFGCVIRQSIKEKFLQKILCF